jgi:hypothetical protein
VSSSPTITPRIYRIGFFLGLATFVLWLLAPGGEMFISMGRGTLKQAVMWPLALATMMAPSIVLVEAGIAGYRGFVSLMRYVSVAVLIVGIAWLVLGFAIPLLLRSGIRQ